jgi:plastocyanin
MTRLHPGLAAVGAFLVAAAAPSAAPLPRRHVVEIRGMAFHPAVLTVERGDTVEWVNRDIVPHTATATDSAWTTGALVQGQSGRHVVAGEPGEQRYFCELHPTMEARLVPR